MPIYFKRKVILFKAEGTPGVDPVPVVATDAMLVRNFRLTPFENEGEERELEVNYVGHKGKILGGAPVKVEFDVEMAASGAAGTAPGYGPLMKACCLAETVTPATSVVYAPVHPGSQTSGTLYFYMGGKLFKALYCIGNVEAVVAKGRIPFWHFSFLGIYAAVSDSALAAPTLTIFQKPLLVTNVNTTPVTLAAYAIKMTEFRMSTGNVLSYRNLVGSEAIRFTDRKSTGSIKFEEELVATKDFHALARAGTLSVLSLVHGTAAGNKVTIAAATAQLDAPTLDQDENIAMTGLSLLLTPTVTGNDEFSLTLT